MKLRNSVFFGPPFAVFLVGFLAAANDAGQLALRILPAGAAPSDLDPSWTIEYPDLADALDHLRNFQDAGAQTLAFEPAAEGLAVTAREGAGAPRHWIIANRTDRTYAGHAKIPNQGGAAGYLPLWMSQGASCFPQSVRAGETALTLSVPARGVVALRPAISFAAKGVEAEITRIQNDPGRLDIEFRIASGGEGAGGKGLKTTVYLEGAAQLTGIKTNGKEPVSFAPLAEAEKIRAIPFKMGKLQELNHVTVLYRPWIWIHIAPAKLKDFPFHRETGGQAFPKTWVCVDDEASESDKRLANRLAESFAAPGARPPRPPLPVITRAQADGMDGPIPQGGPNRISLGPRDSLLFPGFGFQPEEKQHVQGGGALACLTQDPDGYQVIYLVGKTPQDRERVVRRFLSLLKSQK